MGKLPWVRVRLSPTTADALRVYERCRALIAKELGVHPSPETKELHAELLRSV